MASTDRDTPGGPAVDTRSGLRQLPLPGTAATPAGSDVLGKPPGQPEPPPRDREFTVQARSQWQLVLRRFLAHRLAVGSLVVFLLIVVAALVGGRVWKYEYAEFVIPDYSKPPSLKHPFGTDELARDELAQVLQGAQKSVQIALLVAVLSTTIGTIVGLVSGFYRGHVDNLLMRFVDLVLTVPSIAILALLGAALGSRGGGWLPVALILSALLWASIARVIRGVVLSLREREFIEAARALGASDRRIMFRHLLPNVVGPIIVNATIAVAVAILVESALSYIGLGVQPPDTSLGLLIATGQQAAQTRPWLFYFPGLVIILIALTINFIGDGLRDAFDPRQTRVRA